MKKNNKAFTLLELIIVISISSLICVIVSVLMINIMNIYQKANEKAEIENQFSAFTKSIDNFFATINRDGLSVDITIDGKEFEISSTNNSGELYQIIFKGESFQINNKKEITSMNITIKIINDRCLIIDIDERKFAYLILGYINYNIMEYGI